MREFLWQADKEVFLFLSHLPHNLVLDLFFGFITFIGSAGAIWLGIIIFLWFKNYQRKTNFPIFPFGLSFILTLLADFLLKNFFRRPRPQFDLPLVSSPFDFGQSYSFPSGHAMIAFAMAYLLSKLGKFKGVKKWGLYLLAILISFSRIYLGKHYPSDVLAGIVLGILIGILSLKFASFKEIF